MQKPRPCQNSCHKSCHFCTCGPLVTHCHHGICSDKSCHFYIVQVTPLQKWDGCFPLNLPFFFRSETATVAIPYSTFVIRHFSRVLSLLQVFSNIKPKAAERAVRAYNKIISQILCVIQYIIYATKIKMSYNSGREQNHWHQPATGTKDAIVASPNPTDGVRAKRHHAFAPSHRSRRSMSGEV